ncbi:uncharacterized protein LOC126907516 [Daktulosphaira vitifoliae]|uniref:uncharacterized protein LOC126907516 n=1 Tax=Daktulosphaira vitifoliae TaxID=58002 RepID=UPI0021A9C07D|nr:uncharacterized protein LOC126907516 [Daktulosphaira vitifoliae]
MMKLRLYITLFLYTKCAISLDHLELHCNFSKHLFKYFRYSEKYLFNFENKISELELRNYGTAVKSHGKIVMIMLDSLREMDEKYIAADIMTVNLYLNNVSGSINMIGKDENGKLNKSKNSQNLLKGYKILHRSIVERLEYFINEKCLYISLKKKFISLTNFSEPVKYSSAVLLNELEKLNSKIIRNMKEYLTLRDMFAGTDNNILKRYCKIIKHLALTFEKKLYNNFNPKNVLFYDFMENRSPFSELDMISGSQAKQYVRYNSDNQVIDVLDIVRYAPLKLKNNNNQQIKLSDMFRFIKFDFNFQNVQVFLNLLYMATVRPIMLIVRLYIFLVHNFVSIFKFRVSESKTLLKDKIIELGQQIINSMKSFMDLNLYQDYLKKSLSCMFIKTYEVISSFKERNDLITNSETQNISKTYYSYMRKLFVNNTFVENINVTKFNINKIYSIATEEINKITLYVSELKRYQYCFEIANHFYYNSYIDWRVTINTIKQNIPYKLFENHEDIYRSLYFPGININDIKKHIHSPNDENDDMNNDDDKDFDVKVQTYYTPKYLVDYLLYE